MDEYWATLQANIDIYSNGTTFFEISTTDV